MNRVKLKSKTKTYLSVKQYAFGIMRTDLTMIKKTRFLKKKSKFNRFKM